VIDLCAGAGGKTLALAAMMQGKGRLIATDHDKRQLAPIHERLSRAGVHNCDVRTPKGEAIRSAISGRQADLVLIDAPARERHLAAQSRRPGCDQDGGRIGSQPHAAALAHRHGGRIAPPGAGSRAGRIDQNQIG